jgi:hypothetical protein
MAALVQEIIYYIGNYIYEGSMVRIHPMWRQVRIPPP